MKRLLHKENFVGEIREVRVTAMGLVESPSTYSWQKDPDIVGVNAMTLGLWAEVFNRWASLPRRVAAFAKPSESQRITADGGTVAALVPGSITAVAELENGARATYHFSDSAAFGPGNSMEIYGTRGALVYKFFTEEMQGASEGSEQTAPIPVPAEEERFHTTDAEFIAAIREGGPVSPDFEDGVRYMSFCEAVALSAESGQAVELPLQQPAMLSWGRRL